MAEPTLSSRSRRTVAVIAIVAAALLIPTPGDAAVRPAADLPRDAALNDDQLRRATVQIRRDLALLIRERERGRYNHRDYLHLLLRFEMLNRRR